ncbi:hypothetical protein N7G274_001803 [Stereocaulon virgatum]|uniref:Uncharacterized protein n=1 Tax=Stereocaulon virgatum TaxID=373712 RepID=A0ABR4ANF9_9LECA
MRKGPAGCLVDDEEEDDAGEDYEESVLDAGGDEVDISCLDRPFGRHRRRSRSLRFAPDNCCQAWTERAGKGTAPHGVLDEFAPAAEGFERSAWRTVVIFFPFGYDEGGVR